MHQDAVTFGATMRDKIIVLSVSGHAGVDLNGVKLDSTSEIAQALEKMRIDSPDATVSIEADGSAHYEAIGLVLWGIDCGSLLMGSCSPPETSRNDNQIATGTRQRN
jgi:biopolymer transport protein ExbD